MRKQSVSINERTLMYVIGGQLFSQAPNRQPRKVEIIMQKVRDAFRKDATNSNEFYTMSIQEDKLYSYISNLLYAIPEFEELNLTQLQYENGVKVSDESRPKYGFTSAYDKETSESWKRDFIDLDAFIRNVVNGIYDQEFLMEDCFNCINKGTDKCKTCILNPDFKVNRESCRQPKGKYTFACKYDCFKSYYICCEECDKNKSCEHRCDSHSSSCGLAISRIKAKED